MTHTHTHTQPRFHGRCFAHLRGILVPSAGCMVHRWEERCKQVEGSIKWGSEKQGGGILASAGMFKCFSPSVCTGCRLLYVLFWKMRPVQLVNLLTTTSYSPTLSTHCFMSCIWHSMLSCCVLRSWTSYSSLLRSSWRTLVSSLFTMDTCRHKILPNSAIPNFLQH